MSPDQETNFIDQAPTLLRIWASIEAELAGSRSSHGTDWSAATRMIDAAHPVLAQAAKRLRELMIESRNSLRPLEDPFDLDLGLHRWLDAEREEAYSDWLAWVVQQARTPRHVFRLFALGEPPADLLASPHLEVQREYCVPYGHIDQEGRLDLVIRYGNRPIIVVEIKKAEAEGTDTAKHEGYKRWLEEQNCPHAIFLATSAEEETYEGFSFLRWADVCIEMRLLAIDLCKEQPPRMTTAAMVLAFVGAVEQNLLGFSAERVRKICNDRLILFNTKVVDHVKSFLRKLE
jgi:hypothetical protein